MKKIGILVAMDSEMSLVFNRMEQERMKPVNDNFVGLQVFKGAIGDNVVFLCKSGIGKVNAAIAALTIIKEYSPDIIINVGVGGSLDIALSASNIVIGSAAVKDATKVKATTAAKYKVIPSGILVLTLI